MFKMVCHQPFSTNPEKSCSSCLCRIVFAVELMDRSKILANAVRASLANKLRASLAMLGIVVGISALVAIVALIEGASAYITERLVTLQPDVFQVSQLPANFLNVNEFIKA